ncbi:MAG: LPS export ABC transporter periplasmic protein LptC [Alphaproteobacteria bacterium]|jgi:lipopolysaccharide export system protein LptC
MSDAGNTAPQPDASADTRAARRSRLGAAPRRRRSGFGRSRIVSTMKYLLPGIAFALLVLVAVWPRLLPDEDRFRIDLEAVGPAGGAKPQVLNPRLQGIDSAARPFQVTADFGARGDVEGGGEIYDLTNPKADIVLADGSWVALTANDGRFEAKTNTLHLTGDVNLFHDQGYEFTTTAAQVDLVTSTASGDEPVDGQGPFGVLNAEGFRVFDSGDRVLFLGPARLTVFEGATPPQ